MQVPSVVISQLILENNQLIFLFCLICNIETEHAASNLRITKIFSYEMTNEIVKRYENFLTIFRSHHYRSLCCEQNCLLDYNCLFLNQYLLSRKHNFS